MALAILKEYDSKSCPGKKYHVILADSGLMYCDCPKWKFQKGVHPFQRECDHTLDYKREHGE